jgi:Protein of unknown function (DUF3108)
VRALKSAGVVLMRGVLQVGAVLALVGSLVTASPASAESWPASVRAVYDVNFNGFTVGSFEFEAVAEEQSYTLSGNAKLSILLGAFTWDGTTRSFGSIVDLAPKPAAFAFDFKSNLKSGSTRMEFGNGEVTDIKNQPVMPPKPDVIPVREQHLKGVLDPLSAIMAVARGTQANPCERRVPVFDGKERFDLILSPKGETKVTEQQPSGQPGMAHVCRVRYLPIAGHKVDSDTKYMAANDAIEVMLRPIPSANVFVPYQIVIPTMAGVATIVSKRVDIVLNGKPQIALLH